MGVNRLPVATRVALVAMTLYFAGCDAAITPTLNDTCQPIHDDSIVGNWIGVEFETNPSRPFPDDRSLRITRDGDGYRVRAKGEWLLGESLQLFRIGELLVAELTTESLTHGEEDLHTLIAIARRGNTLGLRRLSADWLNKQVEAGTNLDSGRLSADDLVAALTKAGLEAFPSPTAGYIRATSPETE